MIERLCEKIFSNNQFQEELEDILVSSSFLDRRKNTSYDSGVFQGSCRLSC